MTRSNPYPYLCGACDSREIYLEASPLIPASSREELKKIKFSFLRFKRLSRIFWIHCKFSIPLHLVCLRSVASAEQHPSPLPRASRSCPDMESLEPPRISIQGKRFEVPELATPSDHSLESARRVLRILDAERRMRESKFDLIQSDSYRRYSY